MRRRLSCLALARAGRRNGLQIPGLLPPEFGDVLYPSLGGVVPRVSLSRVRPHADQQLFPIRPSAVSPAERLRLTSSNIIRENRQTSIIEHRPTPSIFNLKFLPRHETTLHSIPTTYAAPSLPPAAFVGRAVILHCPGFTSAKPHP